MKWLDGMKELCNRAWYGVAPPERIGILRVAIGAYALWYVGTRSELICGLSENDQGLYSPVGPFRILGGPLSSASTQWLVGTTVASGVAFVLGLAHRVVGPLYSSLLLLTLSYRNSWSMVYHMDNALVLHVLVLGFVRSADAFSFDAWARKHWRPRAGRPDAAARYAWPIRLICAVTVAQYLVSGLAKLLGPSGLAWVSGELLREQIGVDIIRKQVLQGAGSTTLTFAIYDHIWLFTMMGIMTFVLEIGAPVFLFGKSARRAWAVTTWLMHWGIWLIMDIKFRYQLSFIAFLPFFHVERIADLLQTVFTTRALPAGRGKG